MNVCLHFSGVGVPGGDFMFPTAFEIESLENKIATLTSPELSGIIASGIAFFNPSFLDNHNCNSSLFAPAITLMNCFPHDSK